MKNVNWIESLLLFLVLGSFIFAGALALNEIFYHTTINSISFNDSTTIVVGIPGSNFTCLNATLVNGFYFCNVDDITGGILKK
jgi:hypothetical protein